MSLHVVLSDLTLLGESQMQWIMRAEGIFFWPQLLSVFLAVTQILFCVLGQRAANTTPRSLVKQLNEAQGDEARLQQLLAKYDCDLTDVLKPALAMIHSAGRWDQILEVIDDNCNDIQIGIQRRLGYLAAMAHVAMLVGLLGTVWGLTGTFAAIGDSNVAPQPRDLAAGVSQALVTTIIGLLVAIPCLAMHLHLQGQAGRILFRLRTEAERCSSLVWKARHGA